MSLILDALRKSEAERQRAGMPSLHAPAGRHRAPRRIWPLAGTVAALALVGGTSWWMLRTATPPGNELAKNGADVDPASGEAAILDASKRDDVAVAVAQPALDVASQGSLSAAAPLQRESAPMLASDATLGGASSFQQTGAGSGGGEWPAPSLNPAATAAAQPFQAQTAAVPPAPEVSPVAVPVDVAVADPPMATAVRAEGLADPSVRASLPVDAVSAGPSLPMEAPADPALPTIHELDYGVRRELPKLNMSMLVYAKDPQRRFALVNGKRYVPGGEAIEGKVLVVDVLAEGLLCEINGQRFLLPRQ